MLLNGKTLIRYMEKVTLSIVSILIVIVSYDIKEKVINLISSLSYQRKVLHSRLEYGPKTEYASIALRIYKSQ